MIEDVNAAIEEYNARNEPEARVEFYSADEGEIVTRFTGGLCEAGGAEAWFDDFGALLSSKLSSPVSTGRVEEEVDAFIVYYKVG